MAKNIIERAVETPAKALEKTIEGSEYVAK